MGDILETIHEPWWYPSPDEALATIVEQSDRLRKAAAIQKDQISGIGVAISGPFYDRTKTIVTPADFPGWEEVRLVERLRQASELPVHIEHDAMAAALGEWFYGIAQPYRDVYYLYIGHGIGGALITNGQPFQAFSPNTGPLGHLRHVSGGRWDIVGNVLGLQFLYSTLKGRGVDVKNPQQLGELFEQRHPAVWQWLNEALDCLHIIINAINVIVGPEVILLGGELPGPIVAHLLERLQIEDAAARVSFPNSNSIHQALLLQAKFQEFSSAVGAATLPFYDMFYSEIRIRETSYEESDCDKLR